MKTRDWDALAASAPVNKQAALAVGKGGETWAPTIIGREHHVHAMTPPPTRAAPAHAPKLIGLRIGRLTVIGLGMGANPARWVVRCDCGIYEHRKAKLLRATTPEQARRMMCIACDRLEEIKSGKHDTPAEALAHRDAKRAARENPAACSPQED